MNSPRLYSNLYLRVGPTVVQLVNYREEALLRTLRRMLIVMYAYLHYISSTKRLKRVPFTQKDMETIMFFPLKPRYAILTLCPLFSLMEKASLLMVKLNKSTLHGRINIPYSQDSRILFANLHIAVLTYFRQRSLHPRGSFVSDIWE
jgi:hypothetical protein